MRNDDPEKWIHELFAELREQVFDTLDDFTATVGQRIDEEMERRQGSPVLLSVLASVLVELTNLGSWLTGIRPEDHQEEPREPEEPETSPEEE